MHKDSRLANALVFPSRNLLINIVKKKVFEQTFNFTFFKNMFQPLTAFILNPLALKFRLKGTADGRGAEVVEAKKVKIDEIDDKGPKES